ncbi:T9SS type A sorting domain-containing protein [Flavobacterium sp. N1719]|uniref:T9SS type A sorting domain-containing protein n=1 Tax=Flavobacterium sp. N1719 TaxID=2885633 RepID=UPI00222385F8|nr:T9SS type A sorting domain-containing protein [Flavobacterium sp. N1719]
MKRLLLMPVIMLFFLPKGNAQLYVSNNSYVFNRGTLLYSGSNLELNGNNSYLYLRNGGQFLQGTSGSSSNKGVGKLSVFQEGTSNQFAYNYWCSPVGNASAGSGNEDFGISMLNVPTTVTTSNPATLTSAGYDGISSTGAVTIASYWIWRFLSSTNYAQWVQSGASTNIGPGQGFTMKGVSGSDATNPSEATSNNPGNSQRYDFRGKPNDGTIVVNVGSGASTLTGNPYPSAIDLNAFLTDPSNSAIDGTALFWEHDNTVNSHNIVDYRGGYGVYNGLTSVYTPATFYTYDLGGNPGTVYSSPNNMYQRRFSPIGQGFMVRGVTNGSVHLKNSHRVYVQEGVANLSQFQRNANQTNSIGAVNFWDIPNVAGVDYTQLSMAPTPHFTVNASLGGNAVRQIAVCFLPNAIDGIDKADSKSPDAASNLPADMYLVLENEPFVHSTTSFDISKRFNVGFKSNAATTFTVMVKDLINFDLAENIYLFDNTTGLYHDIKNQSYSITLPTGTINDRFQITFTDEALGSTTFDAGKLDVLQNNANQMLTINNPTQYELAEVSLYDMLGKMIFTKKNVGNNSTYEFSTSGLSEGIYIARLKTAEGHTLSKKVIIERVQ